MAMKYAKNIPAASRRQLNLLDRVAHHLDRGQWSLALRHWRSLLQVVTRDGKGSAKCFGHHLWIDAFYRRFGWFSPGPDWIRQRRDNIERGAERLAARHGRV